jgi:TATA-box binding protein (TBP) (component of TFIID and TFIIIB)
VRNANYRGAMKHAVELPKLHIQITNSVLHRKPHQLVVKDLKGTIIFFQSGKFRVMRCIDELEATFLLYKYTNLINEDEFPSITLQSYTSSCNIGFAVNLIKLANSSASLDYIYEPELFPALRICIFKPLCVNVFATGNIIICGLREPEQAYDIRDKVCFICKPFMRT